MIHPLDPAFSLAVIDQQEFPHEIEARVEEIWLGEQRRRGGRLVDGPIFSLSSYAPDLLTLRPTTYRYVIALRRSPELVDAGLTVRPMAVTGILHVADCLVLGRRGSAVAADEGLWEPIPAGGLSQPDPVAQLFEELEEEVGLTRADISSFNTCGLVEDPDSRTVDIIYLMSSPLTGDEVQSRFDGLPGREHSHLAFVASQDIASFLERNRKALLPALPPMLRLAGKLT